MMKHLLLLPLATLIAAPAALGVPLDLDNPQGIAALYSVGGGPGEDHSFVVCTDGTGYRLEVQANATWTEFVASPVPLGEVVDWTPWLLCTTDNRWFARSDVRSPWEEFGVDLDIPAPECLQPVGVRGKGLGALKEVFK
jgi:hypothetical protein